MRTQKAISNIAYHRPEIFGSKLADLRASGKIGPALWIAHKGEDGDKPHIHFVLLGGWATYNTDGLAALWGVDVVDGQPATVTALWRTTKSLNDWLLYAVHHPKYLLTKGLRREVSYTWDDVHCTPGDEDTRHILIKEATEAVDSLGDRTTARLIALAKQGYDWRRVVLSGLVPMGQLSQASRAWEYISDAFGPARKGGVDV